MINSNSRKLSLSGWLKENGSAAYYSPLKLQKFLFFYEAFSKVDGDNTDFSHLRGYERGPVFSTVWGDYTHDRHEFDKAVQKANHNSQESVNLERAKRSQFLVSILSEKELSGLTHQLNIWKTKEQRIMRGEKQVELSEEDFNESDKRLVKLLEMMYPTSLIEHSHIVGIDNHFFIFSIEDSKRLTEQHFDTLSALCDNCQLNNPVYVELDKEGRLIVD